MDSKRRDFIVKLSKGLLLFAAGGVCGLFLNSTGFGGTEANMSTIVVCHKEGGKTRNLVVSTSALNGHLQHGDQIGGCLTADPADMTKIR